MMEYALLLVAPIVAGVLIAVAILVMNGLRERREQRRLALQEARRLDRAPLGAQPAPNVKDRRIAS